MLKDFAHQGKLQYATTFFFYLLVILNPFIHWQISSEYYEFPKTISIYILGGLCVYLWALQGNILSQIKRTNLWLRGFIFLSLLTTLTSSNVYTSIFGYYTRFSEGLIQMLLLFFLLLITKSILHSMNNAKAQLLLVLAGSGTLVAAHSILQHFLMDLPRTYATFGQPNWLGMYLSQIYVLLLMLLLNTKNKSWLYVLAATVVFAGLWYTYSTSALLALLGGVVVSILRNQSKVKDKRLYLLGLFSICLVVAVSAPGIFEGKIRDIFIDVQKVYAQEQSTTNSISDPGFIRTYLWEGTITLILQNPKTFLLGTGPETFPYAFQAYRPAELNYSSEWNVVFNKPHNYFLELAAESGVIALLSFCALLFHLCKDRTYGGIFVAFAIASFFGWPSVTNWLLFFVLTALYENKKAHI